MIKQVLKNWLPPVLYSRLLYLYSNAKFLKYPNKNILASNAYLQGIGRGKRAFLLATGPSITTENLKVLEGEDCFSVSNFFLHGDIDVIKPKFHFFAPYHQPLILENYVEWLRHADQKLPPETAIFLGHTTEKIVRDFNLFPARKIYYLYLAHNTGSTKVDILKPVLAPQSVPLMVLPVLIYMGYEKIYLLGCDHTNLRQYDKSMQHFYDSTRDVRENASDRNAWDDILSTSFQLYNLFRQYEFYLRLIKQNEIKTDIINLSQDSWLNIIKFDLLVNVKGG